MGAYMILRLLRWLTQPQPNPRPHADELKAKYEIVERREHDSLVEVTSKRGTFRYWVSNKPLDVFFTIEGVKHNGV